MPNGKTANSGAQVIIAAASDAGMESEKVEALGERVDEAVGDLGVAALYGDVVPDAVQLGFRLHGKDNAPSAGCAPISHEPCTAALLYLAGQLAHGLLCDDAALAARKGGFCRIDRGQQLGAGALARFP